MTKYKVLKHFQWGTLKLEKNQIILIEAKDDKTSVVSVEHYPDKNQVVSSKAVESMIFLQKIERY